MKKFTYLSTGIICTAMMFTGCTSTEEITEDTPRTDLTTQTIVNAEGETIVLETSENQTVKQKDAVIRTNQSFERVEESTLTIEKGVTTVSDHIKESTLVVENGSTLSTPYLKASKITVKKGGELKVSARIKDSEVIVEEGGIFSVRPDDIDDDSTITEES